MRTNIITIITTLNLLCVAGYFLVTQSNHVQLLRDRASMQDAAIQDLLWQTRSATSDGTYTQGFEAGKLHMGTLIMQGDSALKYSDGYHAALEQFGTMPVTDNNYTTTDLTEDQLIDLLIETAFRKDSHKDSHTLTDEK